jgi:hypothetical protein
VRIEFLFGKKEARNGPMDGKARFIGLVFSCRGRDRYQGMKRRSSFVVEGLAQLKVRMLLRLGLRWLDRSGPDASGSAFLKEAADIALMKPLWDWRERGRKKKREE